MNYREQPPSAALAPYIRCFWAISDDVGGQADFEPVLPDGCPEIVFNLADRIQRQHDDGSIETQPETVFSGQLKRRILIRPSGVVSLFGVRFQPAGAAPFVGIPLTELFGSVISPHLISASAFQDLDSRIREAGSFVACVALFESAMLRILANGIDVDKIAEEACRIISQTSGAISVSRLARRYGITERKLQRIFDRNIGISPKRYSRIQRFQSFVREIEEAESPNILDIALAAGYYDQPHLIREFRDIAGRSPLEYFKQTHRISELFTTAK